MNINNYLNIKDLYELSVNETDYYNNFGNFLEQDFGEFEKLIESWGDKNFWNVSFGQRMRIISFVIYLINLDIVFRKKTLLNIF